MGLPAWHTVKYRDEENKSRPDPPSVRRSPIRRRPSPMRNSRVFDSHTRDPRQFRRPSRHIRQTVGQNVLDSNTQLLWGATTGQERLGTGEGNQHRVSEVYWTMLPLELQDVISSTRDLRREGRSLRQRENSYLMDPSRDATIQSVVDRALHAGSMFRTSMAELDATIERTGQAAWQGEFETTVRSVDAEVEQIRSLRSEALNWLNQARAMWNEVDVMVRSREWRPSRQDSLGGRMFDRTRPTVVRPLAGIPLPIASATSTPPIGSLRVPTPPSLFLEPAPTALFSRREHSVGESSGLGDRSRSASPDHAAETWDSLYMTLEPDAQLPSAESSFASAAASASFSGSTDGSGSRLNSRGSSHTNITVPFADDTACESDENQHVERASRPRRASLRATRNRALAAPAVRTTAHNTYHDNAIDFIRSFSQSGLNQSAPLEPATQGSSIYPGLPPSQSPLPMDMSGILHAPESVTVGRGAASSPGQGGESVINISPLRRYSRSGRSRRRGSTGSPSNDPLADPELEHMRSILQQMANSHDIPEEWWISAGLTPTIAQTSNSARAEANEDVSGNGTEI